MVVIKYLCNKLEYERMVRKMKKKIYVNLLLMTIVISSYVGFLFFVSNEGLKTQKMMPKEGITDIEMINETPIHHNTKLKDIRFNKNLIELM
jgi:hypothetical protein